MACIITYENKQYTQKEFEQYFKEHFTEFVGEFITTKPDVILPIGTSGSGKSTFIKSLRQENLVIIEPDAMRVEFTGNMNDKSKDKEIYIEAANRAIKAIKQGKQVVFDTTNLTKDKRLPFIEAIKKAIPNANIQYKLMELNPELAKQRIKAQLERGENRAVVSDETIDRHAVSYKQMLKDIKNEPITEYKELGSKQDIEGFKKFVDKSDLESFQLDSKGYVEKIENESEAFKYLEQEDILSKPKFNNHRVIKITESDAKDVKNKITTKVGTDNYVPQRFAKLEGINKRFFNKYGMNLYNVRPYGKTYIVTVNKAALEAIKNYNEEANQLESEGVPDEQLDGRIKEFLDKLGIKVNLDGVTDRWGNPIKDAIARAKFTKENLKAVIDIVESKRGLDTLTEEAAHFLVWMLRGTPLYNSMYKETLKSTTYDKVLKEYAGYYNSELMFVEEAMTKKIVDAVIELNKSEMTEEEYKRMNRWFNKVLNWIKEKLGLYKQDSFNIAAMKMLFNDTKGLSLSNIKETNQAFQLQGQDLIDSYADSINKRAENIIINEEKHIYSEGDFVYPISVTTWAKGNRNFEPLTGLANERKEFLRGFGIKGHAELENAMLRAVEERELGSARTPLISNLNDASRKKIDDFAKQIINSFPDGSRFIIEKPIGDKKKGRAGTPDLFVIYKDAKTNEIKGHILDYKFISFNTENGKVTQSEMAKYKKEDYQKQIKEYRRIYKDVYGIDIPIDASLLPINVSLGMDDKKKFFVKNIELSTLDFDDKKPYLSRVPLETERTGIKTVDSVLDSLVEQKRKLKESKPKDEKEQVKRVNRISQIEKAIKKIIITKDLEEFFDLASSELDTILLNINANTLRTAVDLIPYYKSLNFSDYRNKISDDKKESVNNKINNFLEKLQDVESVIEDNLEKFVKEQAEELGITDINSLQADIGWWTKNMSSLSTQQNPYLQALYKLIMKARNLARTQFESKLKEIETVSNAVIEYAKANGIPTNDIFKFMYKKDKNGNIILINKFSKESWDKVTEARAASNFVALKKYLVFNKEKYEERYNHTKLYYENFYRNYSNKDKLIKEALESFEKQYNIEKHNSALLNTSNYYVNFNEKELSYSNEYKHILANKPLKDFYELFTNFVNTSKSDLGLDVNNKFIPQISKSLLEGLRTDGKDYKFLDSLINEISVGENGFYGEVNSITGNPEYNIGMYYQKQLGDNASTDLGKVLALWAKRYYEVKQLSEIEDSAQLLKANLEKQDLLVTGVFGKPLMEDGVPSVVTALNSETLKAFTDFMNEGIYNISIKKDSAIKIKRKRPVLDEQGNIKKDENGKVITESYDVNISTVKTLNKILQWISSKTLGFNIVSGAANLTGGIVNGVYEGVKGRFYTKRHFVKAVGYISSGKLNPKTLTALKYFDILGDMEGYNKANNLSVSKAEKFFTYDRIYFLQKQGDSLIHNSILVAMMQSHGLDSNGKIKHLKELPEGTQSLFDSMEIVNDNLVIKGLTDAKDDSEYLKFRTKVHEVGKKILGNSPSYDIRLVNQSIFGRMAMQFRGWIPRMGEERFGALRYNKNLEAYERGKFFSFGEFLLNNVTTNSLTVLKTLVIPGSNIDKILTTQWNEMDDFKKKIFIKNSGSEEQALKDYIELEKSNIKAAIFEIYTILGVFLLYSAASPDDDEREQASGFRKMYVKMLDRLYNELAFFILPTSFNEILANFIPLTNTLVDLTNLTSHLAGDTAGKLIGSEEMQDKYKPLKYFGKMFPLSHEAVKDLTIVFGNDYWEDFKMDDVED